MTETDLAAAAALMRELSLEFFLHEGGPEAADFFAGENDEAGLRGFMQAGIRYYVAIDDGMLAGFIAIRDKSHLFHMFVSKTHQRQGVAKQLWQTARTEALADGNPGFFTVNASNYAVPVYEKMGFVRTAPTQTKNGINFNPMRLDGSTPCNP